MPLPQHLSSNGVRVEFIQDRLFPEDAFEREVLFDENLLADLIFELSDRFRYVLVERWRPGGKRLKELAAELGCSAQRIRQIEDAAIERLKKMMGGGLTAPHQDTDG